MSSMLLPKYVIFIYHKSNIYIKDVEEEIIL